MATKHTDINKQWVRIPDAAFLLKATIDYDLTHEEADLIVGLLAYSGYATKTKRQIANSAKNITLLVLEEYKRLPLRQLSKRRIDYLHDRLVGILKRYL